MGTHYTVLDKEFRDVTAMAAHPFSATSRKGNAVFSFPDSFLLDALVYGPGTLTPPFYISGLTGGLDENSVMVKIADASSTHICRGVVTKDADTAFLFSEHGEPSGVLVYDKNLFPLFSGSVQDKDLSFSFSDTTLDAGCCVLTGVRYGFSVKGDKEALSGEVRLVARSGMRFSSETGVVYFNLYGESKQDEGGVASVNGVPFTHLWLAAHPDSSVRVLTEAGAVRLVTKASYSSLVRRSDRQEAATSNPDPRPLFNQVV